MGWEWHDRQRDARGRFVPMGKRRQLHVYCSLEEWAGISAAALRVGEEVSEFCRKAAMLRVRYYQENGWPSEDGWPYPRTGKK